MTFEIFLTYAVTALAGCVVGALGTASARLYRVSKALVFLEASAARGLSPQAGTPQHAGVQYILLKERREVAVQVIHYAVTLFIILVGAAIYAFITSA